MKYSINPTTLFSSFPVPCAVADDFLRIATDVQLKVLLCASRHITDGIDVMRISEALGFPVSEVEDALLFWSQNGILICDKVEVQASEPITKTVVLKDARPTRGDVARRGLEDPKVRFLMQEAQQCFGRNLKSNESITLLWLYDDQGMEVSVILMLLQFAKSQQKLNNTFIEKTAVYWIKKGVQNVRDAESCIAETVRMQTAWGVVESIFGIERRQPSERELEWSDRWLNEWKLSKELIKKAYDVCIDSKAKLSMAYIAKILEEWHKNGDEAPTDTEKSKKRTKPKDGNDFAAYDINAFEKMLNSDD